MKKLFLVLPLCILILFTDVKTCSAQEPSGISAKAAVLIEASTGRVIYEKNAYEKLPMASTTKIMTTLLCLESGELDKEFVVDPDAIRVEGSSMGLQEGDIVTKRALCIGMLLPSGNDAANAVAVLLGGSFDGFADLMNERAEEIGMTRTCFVTPSGLEADGHGASALDMSLLAREAMRNEDFVSICSQQTMKLTFGNPPYDRWLKNTNRLLSMYDGVNGVKTGFTDEAGRCLVSACTRNDVSLICVTLNSPSDWNDHISLYDYGYSLLEATEIKPDNYYVDVVGGLAGSIPLKAYEALSVGTQNGDLSGLEERAYIEHFLYAPVENGTYAGYLEYFFDGKLVKQIELYTDAGTEIYKSAEKKEDEAGIIKLIKRIFKRKGK